MGGSVFDGSNLRAVVFDAYGTLFRYHDSEFRTAVTEVLTAQRIDHPDHDEVFRTFFRANPQAGPWGDPSDKDHQPIREAMLSGPLPPWLAQWEIWRRQWKITFDTHGLDGDIDQAANFLRAELTAAETYDDAHETLERLGASGLTVALLSNADEDFLRGALERTELNFSLVHTSESLRAYKPNRAIFDAFCRSLEHEPAEVLYVGDSLATDVQGASNAGLRTAWVRRSDRKYSDELPDPDIEVSSLSEIANLLEGA